ncbi:MAG TPA: hypothetical protein VL972_01390, partial [Solirubrobacteraceae bacterium]|nr:hypothetical protein [Solirubrobacteraceae bacterium]
QELVKDIDIDTGAQPAKSGGDGVATRRRGAKRDGDSTATVEKPPEQAAEAAAGQAPERDPAADLTPEDLVLKDTPKPREKRRRAGGRRNKRHGRSR